jgi:hypothetical protein
VLRLQAVGKKAHAPLHDDVSEAGGFVNDALRDGHAWRGGAGARGSQEVAKISQTVRGWTGENDFVKVRAGGEGAARNTPTSGDDGCAGADSGAAWPVAAPAEQPTIAIGSCELPHSNLAVDRSCRPVPIAGRWSPCCSMLMNTSYNRDFSDNRLDCMIGRSMDRLQADRSS